MEGISILYYIYIYVFVCIYCILIFSNIQYKREKIPSVFLRKLRTPHDWYENLFYEKEGLKIHYMYVTTSIRMIFLLLTQEIQILDPYIKDIMVFYATNSYITKLY